jgi:EAL domain-containing protein (putative c-di-GMP-specific phosphodiesterase class I)
VYADGAHVVSSSQSIPLFASSITSDIERRLLVLDDDPVMREIIAVLAERQGFLTRMAGTPATFFAELILWKPTHITIDLAMPRRDGVEILRELAVSGCDAAILIISGMDLKVIESAQRVAIERGLHVIGGLSKPIKHDVLRTLLDRSWHQINRSTDNALCSDEVLITRAMIATALREDQFVLHYQPKICLRTGKILGIEALVRWQHPQRGLVMPDRFIAKVEQLGMIGQLTEKVIEQAFSWFATSGFSISMTLAINLSALDLGTLSLADVVHTHSVTWGIAPDRVILELTETTAMTNPETALATLTRLRIKGFGLAIDDFGTGYSSMALLAQLPFSSMKIDKSFVMSMNALASSRKIVSSIISLGQSLGLTLVAEGVDSAEVARHLRELGCESAQGFAIAPPMEPAALDSWVVSWVSENFEKFINQAAPALAGPGISNLAAL